VNISAFSRGPTDWNWLPTLLSSASEEPAPPLKTLTIAYHISGAGTEKLRAARTRVQPVPRSGMQPQLAALADVMDHQMATPALRGLERLNLILQSQEKDTDAGVRAQQTEVEAYLWNLRARDLLRVYVCTGDDPEVMWPLRDSIFYS
jgi:hypothetical protein